MSTEIVLKKWGNSLGAVFPKDFIESQNLKENDKIIVNVVKTADLRAEFGTLKTKMTGQQFKDMVRKGWG
jgi:antitoxin component of MazEF toxin-antitoxin module